MSPVPAITSLSPATVPAPAVRTAGDALAGAVTLGAKERAQLDRLALALRRGRADSGPLAGKRRGGRAQFLEHRGYTPGDRLEDLDWNVYGRLNQLAIKSYAEDAATHVGLVIDRSASMATPLGRRGAASVTAEVHALQAGLSVAYLTLVAGRSTDANRVDLVTHSAGDAPPQARAYRGRRGFDALTATTTAGLAPDRTLARPAFADTLTRLDPRVVGRWNLVVVISDGAPQAEFSRALRDLARHTRGPLAWLHIRSDDLAADRLIDAVQRHRGAPLTLVDAETGKRLALTAASAPGLAEQLRHAARKQHEAAERLAHELGVRYLPLPLAPDFFDTLCHGFMRSSVLA